MIQTLIMRPMNWVLFTPLRLLGMLISGQLIYTSYQSRRASISEVIWNTRIWSKDWIMPYLPKQEVRLIRSQMLEMRLMQNLEHLRKTKKCHFELQLQSRCING